MIYTEWDKLEEVIVGKAYNIDVLKQFDDQEFVDGLGKILEETEEDFQKLSNLFKSADVKVHRPRDFPLIAEQHRTWQSAYPYPAICPRDFHIVYGNTILGTAGGDCNRYTEHDYFLDIMLKKYAEGKNYINMPKPLLNSYYRKYKKMEGQIMFHAACVLKAGDTLLHTRPYNDDTTWGKGTKAGLDWVKRNIDRDVHWVEIPAVGHADGKLALLKPGVVMCYNKKHIPKAMKKWTVIQAKTKELPEYFHKIKSQHFYKSTVQEWLQHWIGYVDETVFDINVISLDEHTVITNGYDADVYAQLKANGIEGIPFNFRHKYFWDSGLHCVTLDLKRKGGPDSYV
jgi:N-dimethylarginine dimethylaminohydrolase